MWLVFDDPSLSLNLEFQGIDGIGPQTNAAACTGENPLRMKAATRLARQIKIRALCSLSLLRSMAWLRQAINLTRRSSNLRSVSRTRAPASQAATVMRSPAATRADTPGRGLRMIGQSCDQTGGPSERLFTPISCAECRSGNAVTSGLCCLAGYFWSTIQRHDLTVDGAKVFASNRPRRRCYACFESCRPTTAQHVQTW